MRLLSLKASTNATWQDILEEFLLYKTAQGLAQSTVLDYAKHVKMFYKKYPNAYKYAKKYSLMYLSEDIKPATYNLRLNYLKAFFAYCVEEGYMKDNPLSGIHRKKAEPRIVDVDLSNIKKILDTIDKKTFTGLRDYTLILLQLDTGIRPKEALSLMLNDIDLANKEITIRAEEAKTRRKRILPISKVTVQAINKFLLVRPENWNRSPVFCSYEGEKFSVDSYYRRLNDYSKQLGLHIRPYDLRHAFALNFLRNEGNVFALQRTLGHTDLSMTKRYIALTQEDLRVQHDKATPVNMLVSTRVRKVKP